MLILIDRLIHRQDGAVDVGLCVIVSVSGRVLDVPAGRAGRIIQLFRISGFQCLAGHFYGQGLVGSQVCPGDTDVLAVHRSGTGTRRHAGHLQVRRDGVGHDHVVGSSIGCHIFYCDRVGHGIPHFILVGVCHFVQGQLCQRDTYRNGIGIRAYGIPAIVGRQCTLIIDDCVIPCCVIVWRQVCPILDLRGYIDGKCPGRVCRQIGGFRTDRHGLAVDTVIKVAGYVRAVFGDRRDRRRLQDIIQSIGHRKLRPACGTGVNDRI